MKTLKIISIALFLSFLLIGCGNNKKKIEVIKIGVIAPLTGEGATYGASMKRGFDLAFKSDSTIKLIYEDDKLEAKDGVNAINKLINSDKVKLILGSAASAVTLAIAPIAEKNKIILFSTISTTDNLKNSGDYIFRNVPRNELQGNTAAELVFNHLNIINAGIYGENDEYGTNLTNSFKNHFEELGGKIVFNDNYSDKQKDYKTSLLKIKNTELKALFIPGNYQESALILKQAKELGLNIFIIGGDGSYSPELIKISGNNAEGFYITLMSVNKETDYYKKFYSNFITEYNQEPDIYDAYAYEGGMIIHEAILKVGYNADNIKQYLYNTVFQSMTGDLKFDKDGEVIRDYGIVKVKGGAFIEENIK